MSKPVIFIISAAWDQEASVWSGHCDEIPAAADAPTLDEDNPVNAPTLRAMGSTATALAVELHPLEIRSSAEGVLSTWADTQPSALIVSDHGIILLNARAIGTFAAEHRLPSIGPLELAQNGGLIAYGVSFLDQFRSAAFFVDKILKGASPKDIPVEQASKFVTVVNIKAAKALGIEMPTSILVRADEVTE